MYLKIKTESYTTDLLNIIIAEYIFLNITKKNSCTVKIFIVSLYHYFYSDKLKTK